VRRIGWIFGVLALVATACRRTHTPVWDEGAPAGQQAHSPERIVVPPGSALLRQLRVESVQECDVAIGRIEAPGKVEVNPDRVFRVMLPVAGRVAEVYARLGDAVKESSPLLALESPDAEAAVSSYLQADAARSQAHSALIKAQADYERLKDLYEHDAVAQKEVLSAENMLVQARAAVEQAEALRRQAQARLEILGLQPAQFGQRIMVRAPISGKVLEVNVARGEYRNDTTVPVMTIADLSTVWISADVPESAIRLIRVGEQVDIELVAYPGKVFQGRVARIADTVDPQTRTVKVRAELSNRDERFRPEMFGRIVHTETVRRLPVVPATALVHDPGGSVMFREDAPGVFRRVQVSAGPPSGDRVPILEGVRAGDRVVTQGVMLLQAKQGTSR
jgi:cobalt-zinc-cadmium efflux system membrane fusion protein